MENSIILLKSVRSARLFILQTLLGLCLCYQNAFASGFDALIKDVMPSGTMSNVTSSAIVKEQAAGHFIGGSVIIKSPSNPPLQPFQARAPSCKLGGLPCSAQLELLGGALSLISGEELVRYLKTLPQSAMTYGAMMAIKSLCPQCQDLLEYLDAKADWLNKMSFDGCQMVQDLMDPMLPKEDAKKQAVSQSNMLLNGEKKDMAAIQKDSKTGTIDTLNPELESQLIDEYNLVWKAMLAKTPTTGGGKGEELKEILMSISGTIIATKDGDGKPSIKHLKSLTNKDLIKEFIGINKLTTRKVKAYKCNESEKCLKPVASENPVLAGAFLHERVSELLKSIVTKIHSDDGALTPDEEALIAYSSDQLVAKIEMDLGTYSKIGNVTDNLIPYVESLCFDVVTRYLEDLLREVQEAVAELGHTQIAGSAVFKAFAEETREIMRLLANERHEARGKYDMIQKSKERLRHEQEYHNKTYEKYMQNPK